ncbi:hypothetical protein AAHC03_02057 [Spirometra sp. Aus1]
MEDKSAGIQSIKREMEEPDRKQTLRDPEDDRYLYCYECECMVLDACEKHPNMWIENVVVGDCEATSECDLSRCSCLPDKVAHAKKTAPSEYVSVRPSSIQSAGLGVWSEREIPLGTVCGPYSGEVVYLHSLTPDELDARFQRGYAWLIRENRIGTKGHIVDAVDPVTSNWLRFVNCARNDEEQNFVTIQYRGKIYYRACKTIPPNVELLTVYGEKFSRKIGTLTADETSVIPSEGEFQARRVKFVSASSILCVIFPCLLLKNSFLNRSTFASDSRLR